MWLAAIWAGLKKVGSWIKKYWKIVSGFVLALGGIAVAARIADELRNTQPAPVPNLDEANKELSNRFRAANIDRDRKIVELTKKHKNRLNKASVDMRKEYDELRDKPVEEVVEWFNKL